MLKYSLVAHGSDLLAVKEALGHSDLSTTSVYLHLNSGQLRRAVECHPLARRG